MESSPKSQYTIKVIESNDSFVTRRRGSSRGDKENNSSFTLRTDTAMKRDGSAFNLGSHRSRGTKVYRSNSALSIASGVSGTTAGKKSGSTSQTAINQANSLCAECDRVYEEEKQLTEEMLSSKRQEQQRINSSLNLMKMVLKRT